MDPLHWTLLADDDGAGITLYLKTPFWLACKRMGQKFQTISVHEISPSMP